MRLIALASARRLSTGAPAPSAPARIAALARQLNRRDMSSSTQRVAAGKRSDWKDGQMWV